MPFPVVFSIDGSARHEIIVMDSDTKLSDLKSKIESTVSSSVNCEEFMSKYKKKDSAERVGDIKVRWAKEGRDGKIFPATTIVTDDNCEAVWMMMEAGVGKDVLEVSLEAPPKKEGEEKEESKGESKGESKEESK